MTKYASKTSDKKNMSIKIHAKVHNKENKEVNKEYNSKKTEESRNSVSKRITFPKWKWLIFRFHHLSIFNSPYYCQLWSLQLFFQNLPETLKITIFIPLNSEIVHTFKYNSYVSETFRRKIFA